MTQSHPPTVAQLGLARDALGGQVAVVTGAGQGIGQEAARTLAWLGARVIVAESGERGGHTESLVVQAGGEALWVPVDVADEASVARLAQRTREQYGLADILINSAAVNPVVSALEMETALWDRVIAVNLRGAFLTCKAFLPQMVARGRGTVVNLVSDEATPGLAAHIASKRGLAGFSQSLALEVGPRGVWVVALTPGLVDMPGMHGVTAEPAPHLGTDRDRLLGVSLPADRPEPVPATDAGAAVAYLVAGLAQEYYGRVVTTYEVLERAGYIHSAQASAPNLAPTSPAPDRIAHPTSAQWTTATALADRLVQVLAETGAEFDRLPVFGRLSARRGFKARAGQSLPAWQQAAAALVETTRRAQAGDAQSRADLRAGLRVLEAQLEALKGYYLEAQAQAARSSRDAGVPAQATDVAVQRAAVVDALRAAVQRAAGG